MNEWNRRMTRKEFLQWMGLAGTGAALAACSTPPGESPAPMPSPAAALPTGTTPPTAAPAPSQTPAPAAGQAYLGVAHGSDPAAITLAAVAALGGMQRFVKAGNDVIIKPNICTDYYSYEYAATTNPEVVAALVRMALEAGAKRVRVMDYPFGGSPESAYARSGIADAVAAAGGQMEVMNRNKFVNAAIPNHLDISQWDFYRDVIEADVVINVPIAKNHGQAGLTLGCKNMMGVVLNRGRIHTSLHKRIADLASLVRPELTVVDAVRTLMANGPTGGSLNDVRLSNTVLASHDIVAADTYAAKTFFNKTPDNIQYIRFAETLGLGTTDLSSVKVEEVSL